MFFRQSSSLTIGWQELQLESVMAEGTEIEDRVDFDDDNYIEEEMDDDVEEEQIEDEGSEGGDDENNEEQQDDLRSGDTGKEQSPEGDRNHVAIEPLEDEEKGSSPIDEDEKEKRAKLLALPPHGSEIFIGALPRDVSEEELMDLCESMGEIVEVCSNALREGG